MHLRLTDTPSAPRILPDAGLTEPEEHLPDLLRTPLDGAASATRAWRRYPAIALDVRDLSPDQAARFVAEAAQGAFRFDALRTRPEEEPHRLATLEVVSTDPAFRAQWPALEAEIEGADFARRLVVEPSNRLTPATFLAHLDPLRRAGVAIEAIGASALREQGFGGLLAVGGGSVHPPVLIVLRWAGRTAPVALVGKGITFDTGGVCVKPADRMWDMRADMAGAAACAGAMLALARRRSPCGAIAVLAVAENALGGGAYRPGDVIRSFAGRSVEVVDTDAEGRLVLMDALAFAARERPAAILDAATLTGAAVVALGHARAALFANDDALARAVAAAGEASGERLWRLPIGARHREDLESAIADLRHCVPGRGQPDACHAAAFLREFVGDVPWAHIDMAGTDLAVLPDGGTGGPTGFGVRLFDRVMRDRFEAAA